jgi:nucleotide-binding universal stress UspA family protein
MEGNGLSVFPAHILLATDGSRDADGALRAAADISEKSGAALHVVHVWTDVMSPAKPGLVLDDHSRFLEEKAGKLLRWQAWKARAAGGRAVWVYLREGEPVEEIGGLAEELDADLVVVGNRGAGRVKRLITGSVSEGVVHRASCPVLVVRGEEGAWPIKRVVVGDDGSWSAQRAGKLAAEIADLFGAEVVLVRAYENPPAPVGGWSAEDRRELDEERLRNLQELEGRAERLEVIAQDRPETRLAESKATPAIVSVAEEGEEERTLLAVGSRGLGAPGRALFGSVSTKVLRAVDGPVLVVSPDAAPRGDRGMRPRAKASEFEANEESV